MALILALFFTIIAIGLVITGTSVLRANKAVTETSFRLNSQARQFAGSGLVEAQTWFRRQTSQPCLQFEPIIDLTTTPPILDTDDAEIGIMRQFRIAGTTWGRYEVWKEWAGDPDPVRLAWRQQMEVDDISTGRGMGTPGTGWRLRAIGIVYRMSDSTKRYDERPNHVLAQEMLEAEIMRMIISPPGQAALSVSDGNSAHINNYGRIIGGPTGAGIFYPTAATVSTTAAWTSSISPSPSAIINRPVCW